MKKLKTEILWVVSLAALAAFVWCAHHDRLTAANWKLPTHYGADALGGDSLSALAWIKAASEWNYIPFRSKFVDRLGAPYPANWNDYPMGEELLIFLMGLGARALGLFTAANLAMLLGHVTAALSFYLCCRFLRFRREWAWVGAALFGFTYFNTWRGLGHLFVAFSYTIPPAILCCWIIGGSRRLRWGGKLCWFCLLWALCMGLSNPYNLNMYAQLIGLALLVQILTRRRKVNLLVGGLSLAVAFLGFLAINLDTLSCAWANGQNPRALERSYYQTELFALKPMELIVPPTDHKLGAFARIGSKYYGDAWVKGETFSPYLGMICIAGMVWMLFEGLVLVTKPGRRGRRFPTYPLLLLWVLLYSTIGGLTNLFALGGMVLFRCSDRYSVFISALILFFLVSRASTWGRRWKPATRYIVAVLALGAGLWDQLPLPVSSEETQAVARVVESDRGFAERMEEKLPPGAMVFQLPYMEFPESTPIQSLQPYEHFRPYLLSKTLRFSFGAYKGRAREDWQEPVAKLPAARMVEELERFGFSALCLNRKGFNDHGNSLLQQLLATGRTQVIEDDLHDQVCLVLHPASTPVLPSESGRIPLVYQKGWWNLMGVQQGDQLWTTGNASLSFYNPRGFETAIALKCQVASLEPRLVIAELNGREVWRADLGASQVAPVNILLNARPGKNQLRFITDTVPRSTRENPVPRAFAVIGARLTSNPDNSK